MRVHHQLVSVARMVPQLLLMLWGLQKYFKGQIESKDDLSQDKWME